MTRMWIVVGDPTSSGGRVVSGSPFTDIDGKPVSRVTDSAICPAHKGVFPIVDGDSTMLVDGQPVALHGSSLACGCKVLSAQQSHVLVDAGGAAAPAVTQARGERMQAASGQHVPAGASPAPAPGATVPPPGPPCSITSQTVATSPSNRARTRIGVAERVRLRYNSGAATWRIVRGGGTLSATSGSTVTYTAGEAAAQVEISATGSSGACSIVLDVVEPASWIMKLAAGRPKKHRNGRPDCGWLGEFFVHPADVNFDNLQTREVDSTCTASGGMACQHGNKHGSYPGPDFASPWFRLTGHTADGTTDSSLDQIYSGDCGAGSTGTAVPFTAGQLHFDIRMQWQVYGATTVHDFPMQAQESQLFADGHCETRKGGHTESILYSEPTSWSW